MGTCPGVCDMGKALHLSVGFLSDHCGGVLRFTKCLLLAGHVDKTGVVQMGKSGSDPGDISSWDVEEEKH